MKQEAFNQLYSELEPALMPILRSAAKRFSRSLGMDPEEALQEARIALATALKSYDYNRSRGGVYNFAREAVSNALYGLMCQATSQSRMPSIPMVSEAGEATILKYRPTSLDAMDYSGAVENAPSPECFAEEAELADRMKILKMRLINGLNDRERRVFACMVHPSDEFLTFMRNISASESSNEVIAKYLRVSKNAVDWSIHKIRRQFTLLAEEEFSDIIRRAIEEGKWPMIYASARENDVEFIQSIMAQRKLDPRPSQPRVVVFVKSQTVRAVRSIERYTWGAILHLKLNQKSATVILEGRFNENTGEVLNAGGYWKPLSDSVSWYNELNRALGAAHAE